MTLRGLPGREIERMLWNGRMGGIGNVALSRDHEPHRRGILYRIC